MNPLLNPSKDTSPLVLLGGGGHARVLIDLFSLIGRRIQSVLDDDATIQATLPEGICYSGSIADLHRLPKHEVRLANAIGSVGLPELRRRVFRAAVDQGFSFTHARHPSAVVAGSAELGHGVQLMAGVIVGPGAVLGDNVLLNTRACVDHDAVIGDHSHLAPGVTVCGGVTIGSTCHLGCGATVIQGVTIGDDVLVAAGAVVTRDVPSGQRVAGVPAKGF